MLGAALQNLLKLLERIVDDSSLYVPAIPEPHSNNDVVIY